MPCCEPVPGDDIVGYSTQLRGITVHRVDCANIRNPKEERLVNVSWAPTEGKLFTARLKAEGIDRSDLLSDAARAIGAEGGSIAGIKASTMGNSLMRMKVELRVRNLEHLYAIIAKLNEVKGIMEVTRG